MANRPSRNERAHPPVSDDRSVGKVRTHSGRVGPAVQGAHRDLPGEEFFSI